MGGLTMWLDDLRLCGEVRSEVNMARYTTLRVGGKARWFFTPTSQQSIVQAMTVIPNDIVLLPLGRGSNMLVSDDGFDGIVVDLRALKVLSIEGNTVFAQAGVKMNRLSRLCADSELAGLEFMATIPGDVGGGIVMNAGAFGQQVSDTLASINVVCRDGILLSIQAKDLKMSYRCTVLPKQSIILGAAFQLQLGDGETLKSRMLHMRETRSKTQPLSMPNCGSVFKNPVGDFAARLLEEAGMKGHREGGAQFSTTHANFIVNHGHATCQDILALINDAKVEVLNRFGVQLETEVRVIR